MAHFFKKKNQPSRSSHLLCSTFQFNVALPSLIATYARGMYTGPLFRFVLPAKPTHTQLAMLNAMLLICLWSKSKLVLGREQILL